MAEFLHNIQCKFVRWLNFDVDIDDAEVFDHVVSLLTWNCYDSHFLIRVMFLFYRLTLILTLLLFFSDLFLFFILFYMLFFSSLSCNIFFISQLFCATSCFIWLQIKQCFDISIYFLLDLLTSYWFFADGRLDISGWILHLSILLAAIFMQFI